MKKVEVKKLDIIEHGFDQFKVFSKGEKAEFLIALIAFIAS
jgi:hypothetical protein